MEADPKMPGGRPPGVLLVGAGVVGRAILKAHLDAGLGVRIADADSDSLEDAITNVLPDPASWRVSPPRCLPGELHAVDIEPPSVEPHDRDSVAATEIVIESIVERADVKQAFFAEAESWCSPRTVFCSNTSTLTIASLGRAMRQPGRLCGMHFFMPVHERPAVEVIAAAETADRTVRRATRHAERIGKRPLRVADAPGFVVNRMLSPYLGQALMLVTRGATAAQLERAAETFGMPMSPLELIDWIGARTAFDAGRVFWQAFPQRMDPSPLLAAMVKRRPLGRSAGGGFYRYAGGDREAELSPEALELCDRYAAKTRTFTDEEVLQLLAIPMWIEALCALRDGVVDGPEAIEIAMAGGLGFTRPGRWFEYFDRLGMPELNAAVAAWSAGYRGMRPPASIAEIMAAAKSPRDVIRACRSS